jgi:hypothetical protein
MLIKLLPCIVRLYGIVDKLTSSSARLRSRGVLVADELRVVTNVFHNYGKWDWKIGSRRVLW